MSGWNGAPGPGAQPYGGGAVPDHVKPEGRQPAGSFSKRGQTTDKGPQGCMGQTFISLAIFIVR